MNFGLVTPFPEQRLAARSNSSAVRGRVPNHSTRVSSETRSSCGCRAKEKTMCKSRRCHSAWFERGTSLQTRTLHSGSPPPSPPPRARARAHAPVFLEGETYARLGRWGWRRIERARPTRSTLPKSRKHLPLGGKPRRTSRTKRAAFFSCEIKGEH